MDFGIAETGIARGSPPGTTTEVLRVGFPFEVIRVVSEHNQFALEKQWLKRKRMLDLKLLRYPAILALELELKKSLGVICLVKKRWSKKVLRFRELRQ
jgi:hypothetical protein